MLDIMQVPQILRSSSNIHEKIRIWSISYACL